MSHGPCGSALAPPSFNVAGPTRPTSGSSPTPKPPRGSATELCRHNAPFLDGRLRIGGDITALIEHRDVLAGLALGAL